MIYWPAKAPGETEDFAFDFTAALQSGEHIVGTPVIAAVGVTASAPSVSAGIVTVWLSGGTIGTVATVSCTITTDSGPARTYTETAVLLIGDAVVTLASAKAWLRVETTDEDELIEDLIADAVGMVERATAKNLTPRIEQQTVDGFRSCYGLAGFSRQPIALFKGPVSQVISIAYDDIDGVEQTLPSFRLASGFNSMLFPAVGASWPQTLAGAGTVRIAYLAGYAPGARPRELDRAVKMLVAHWYQNREAVNAGVRAAAIELPLGVADILDMHRSPGIA